ncbi:MULTISPECIES: acyltransferase [unclassified Caballeronia]|uniref:acyltransferase family protein n=1 Tax=unclassified Caballeronia TaxID=2646786 RepID=UPI002027977C|nr:MULTISPECIES: acyltransferase [unclassified Caballeronia]MDR5774473.1 acyltransferase [Caballeronia sp. LZ002]MDR5849909.1 acyltransferase [Caballeronia sp. LZ003]
MAETNNRYEALDGLRGVAALAVMISHLSQEMLFRNAYEAVDLFFVLSGFVIAHSYGARLQNGMTNAEYIKRRIIRLYPMLIFSLLIGLPVFIEAGREGLTNFSSGNIISSTLYNSFLAPYIGELGGPIFPSNPPAWSLFFEMVASLSFVLIVRLQMRSIFKMILLSAAAFLTTSALTTIDLHGHGLFDFEQGWSGSRFDGGFFRVAFGFLVGVFLYNKKDSITRIATAIVPRAFANIYFLFTLVLVLFFFPMSLHGIYPMFIIFGVAPWLVAFGSTVRCTSAVDINIARFLGWISYPIYLIHYPIGQAVFMYFGKANQYAVAPMLATCAITIVCAVLLTKFVEEPIRAFLAKRFIRSSKTQESVTELGMRTDQHPV